MCSRVCTGEAHGVDGQKVWLLEVRERDRLDLVRQAELSDEHGDFGWVWPALAVAGRSVSKVYLVKATEAKETDTITGLRSEVMTRMRLEVIGEVLQDISF